MQNCLWNFSNIYGGFFYDTLFVKPKTSVIDVNPLSAKPTKWSSTLK